MASLPKSPAIAVGVEMGAAQHQHTRRHASLKSKQPAPLSEIHYKIDISGLLVWSGLGKHVLWTHLSCRTHCARRRRKSLQELTMIIPGIWLGKATPDQG